MTEAVTVRNFNSEFISQVNANFEAIDAVLDELASRYDSLADLKLVTGEDAGETVITAYRSTIGDGGGGIWIWRTGDQSANVTADTQSGIWAAPDSDSTGASGAWQRQWTGRIQSQWYGCRSGVTSNTALNAFLAAAAAGNPAQLGPFVHQFDTALTAFSGNRIDIIGTPGSVLKYVGASTTPGNLITIGNGTSYAELNLRGFHVESSTTLTAGYAIRIRNYYHINFDIWVGDEHVEGWKLYDGVWFDGCVVIYLHTSHFYAINRSVIWSNGVEMHCCAAFIKGDAGTGTGIHIGGGCGGFNGESLQQLLNDIGLLVDTSIVATGNDQIYLNDAEFDTNTTVGVRLDDALSGSKFYAQNDGWIGATQAGNGLEVLNWASGIVDIQNGYIVNSSGNALHIEDNTATYLVGDGARFQGTGYGIYASVATTVYCNSRLVNNTAGNISANVTIKTSFDSSILNGTALPSAIVGSSLTSVGTLTSLAVSGALTYAGTAFAASVSGSAGGSLVSSSNPVFSGLVYMGGSTSSYPALRRTSAALDVVLGDQSGLAALNAGTITTYNLVAFNGNTSSFPALRRSTTALEVVLADQSAYTTLNAGSLRAVSNFGLMSGVGAGGTATQGSGSGKATGVTLNKICGQITTDAATLNAATTVSFTLTNSTIAATDVMILNHVSGGTAGAYTLNAQCGASSATINIRNVTAGNLSEAIVIAYVVIKAVTS